jgi:hypothetical protein
VNDFMANPEGFLSRNQVVIYGIRADKQPPNDIGTFGFYFEAEKDRYVFTSPCLKPGAYQFEAFNVPAVLWAAVPNRGTNAKAGSFAAIHGTPLTGAPTIMLTTQFTGCTFCVNKVGSTVYAAHIAPSNRAGAKQGETVHSIDPTELATQICNTGDFENANGHASLRVYGRDRGKNTFDNGYLYKTGSHGGSNWMTIIGFKDDTGDWALYTQSIAQEHPKPKRVRQIFPQINEAVS